MAKKRLLEKLQELLMDELDEDEIEESIPSADDSPTHEIPQETFELINAAYAAVQEAQTQYTTLVPQLEAQKSALWGALRRAREVLDKQVVDARDECGVPDEPGWTLNFPDNNNVFPNFSKIEEEE